MVRRTHKYADGGKVMAEPEKGRKPKKITSKNPPGGARTPGAKATKKYADGGTVKSYGAPTSPPTPGSTTRARPKPGDKDPNFKPKKPKKPSAPKPKPLEADTRRVPAPTRRRLKDNDVY